MRSNKAVRFFVVSKLEIVDLTQIDNTAVQLSWKINETIESALSSLQVQYRFIHPKTSWMATDELYNRSASQAIVSNLQPGQVFKFRLVGFDKDGRQLVISAAKRMTLELMKNRANTIVPEMIDASVTNDGQISVTWKVRGSQCLSNADVSLCSSCRTTPMVQTWTVSSSTIDLHDRK